MTNSPDGRLPIRRALISVYDKSGHIDDLNDWQVQSWPSTPEGEERQAAEIEEHYRTLFSHPAVESMTYWGLSDRGMWLGAPGGLLREDGSPKPSYERLRQLITEEWWLPPTTLRTGEDGTVQFAGFLGEYEIRTADGATADLDLASPGELAVSLTPAQG